MINSFYNNKDEKIEVVFTCIQPIKINSDGYIQLLLSDNNVSEINKISNKKFTLEWLSEFGDKNNIFDYLKSIKTCKVDNEILKNELTKHEVDFGNLKISEFLDTNNSKYELLYDLKFLYFLLVYEIRLFLPISSLEVLLCDKNNLYTLVRSLLVKENDNSSISNWATDIREEAITKVIKVAKTICPKFKGNYVDISNNSGNITSIVFNENFKQNCELEKLFISCNEISERLQTSLSPIYSDDNVSYAFYGRFHTIMIKNENDFSRYMPIQYQMQYLWYLINQYNIMMDQLNVELLDSKNQKNLEKQNDLIDEVINKIEMLTMYNENFSRAIELDNELIYKKIEKKWNIFSSLDSSKSYITFFKDYLERTFNKKISKAQKRQNNILFVISLIQIIALVSVWNDYLALLDESSIQNVDELIFLFNGSIDNLMMFNGLMPLGLFVIVVISLLYMAFKK